MKKSNRIILFVLFDLLVVIVGLGWFLKDSHFFSHNNAVPVIAQKPSITRLSLSAGEQLGDYTMFALPGDLGQAKINDIVFDAGAMWIGSNKGLLKIKGSRVTVYRQFSRSPYEWVNHVAVTPYGLAVNTLVAKHNYAGNFAGSYLFDIKRETWRRIGSNINAQAWLDGYLYQVSTKLVRLNPLQSWQKQVLVNDPCGLRMSTLALRAINAEVWMTGDAIRRHSPGCGVVRYNPKTGNNITYRTEDGLNDNTGADIGGDSTAVFMDSSKSGHLNRFDQKSQKWRPLSAGGTGNHMIVTAEAIWLGTLNPKYPLIRIDRRSDKTSTLSALSSQERISAMGIHDKEVWFGTYVTSWHGQSYTIQSRLGRYIDVH